MVRIVIDIKQVKVGDTVVVHCFVDKVYQASSCLTVKFIGGYIPAGAAINSLHVKRVVEVIPKPPEPPKVGEYWKYRKGVTRTFKIIAIEAGYVFSVHTDTLTCNNWKPATTRSIESFTKTMVRI